MWLLLFLGSPGMTSVNAMLLPVTNSVWFVCEERSSTDFLSVHVINCAPSVRSPSVKDMCDVGYHHTKTSGRGTKRAFMYPVGQAEFISIILDSFVRTGVLAFVGWVLLLGRGFRLCVCVCVREREQLGSAKWGLRLRFEQGFFFGGGGALLSQDIWLIRSAWLRQVIRHTTEVWVGVKYPVVLLSYVVHQGVWAGQQEGEMAKMCEVIQDSWPMLKTGGRGSSQTSEQHCRATRGS